ncbi:3BHS-like protein [Mya arenaria]|uniref:3BHS-like protein n=1 Tax=Mya arenaria TaxID=6604 RepID=A0ABY7E0Z8_MYAAR|nr:3BHS-like protein [Mya arenaria]
MDTGLHESCVVLVTGGAGFLGHKEAAPVRQYLGSLTDELLVGEACRGANCVMHVASIVDTAMFPDPVLSYNINVLGTETVIRACKAAGVRRLIYCSSCEVVSGRGDIPEGTEDNTTPFHTGHFFEPYGSTKYLAEKMVLEENCSSFRTVSLRPVIMYGEEEWRSIHRAVGNYVIKKTGTFFPTTCGGGRAEHAYVGNVAWGFVCAEHTLWREDAAAAAASGQSYFLCDDSPRKSVMGFISVLFEESGYKISPVAIPRWFILFALYATWLVLILVSLVYKNVNTAFGTAPFIMMPYTLCFRYDKATKLLGYSPIFSFEEAKRRTVNFIKTYKSSKVKQD